MGAKMPTIKEMLDVLEQSTYRTNAYELLSDVFTCGAIAVSNRFDGDKRKEREETYLQIMNKHDRNTQELIVKLFGMIFTLLSNQIEPCVGFGDYLGELYMKSKTNSSRSGQFFTPYNISRLCAELSLERETVMRCKQNKEVLTIHEPAVGSGGMLIATIDVLYNQYNFNIAHDLFIECADIDTRCVHMAYLQLSLAGVPAVVRHQDTLSLKTWDTWITPALIVQWLRFKKYVNGE